MSKKYLKFSLYSLLAVIMFFNFSVFLSPGQASTKVELENQLDLAGSKAWGNPPGETGMAEIVQYVISAFLGLLGIIFLVLIIYSGFNWMTAQGDEEKVTLAKDTLSRAVIGLIIIIAAYSITYFVFSSLSGTDGASSPTGKDLAPG